MYEMSKEVLARYLEKKADLLMQEANLIREISQQLKIEKISTKPLAKIQDPKTLEVKRSGVALLRLDQVLEIIPVAKSTWWNGVKSGKYPQPVKLSPRVTTWRKADILELIG